MTEYFSTRFWYLPKKSFWKDKMRPFLKNPWFNRFKIIKFSPINMAIIRHTIPVTTNAASNLSTEKKKKFYKYNINFFSAQK